MAKPVYHLDQLSNLAGHTIRDDEGGKVYQVLKNNSGGALANGDVVILDSSVAAGDNVTTTTTADSPLVKGVSVDAPANAAYGRVQIEGAHTAVKVIPSGGAIAAGDRLSTFTTAKTANKAATPAVGGVLGIALSAHASSTTQTTGTVLIRLR